MYYDRAIDKCQADGVEEILRHCGLWREQVSRPPPVASRVVEGEPSYDYGYFERVCIIFITSSADPDDDS